MCAGVKEGRGGGGVGVNHTRLTGVPVGGTPIYKLYGYVRCEGGGFQSVQSGTEA